MAETVIGIEAERRQSSHQDRLREDLTIHRQLCFRFSRESSEFICCLFNAPHRRACTSPNTGRLIAGFIPQRLLIVPTAVITDN